MLGSVLAGLNFKGLIEQEIGKVTDRILDAIPMPASEKERARIERDRALADSAGPIADALAREAEFARDMYLADAESNERFRSWWRPALGWIGGFCFLWEVFLRQTVNGALGTTYEPIPTAVWEPLMWVLLTLIGVRSAFDKGAIRFRKK